MLRTALATLRFRWASFAGAALALVLGSGVAAMMITTLAAASVTSPGGDPGQLSSAQAMAGTSTLLGVSVAVFVVAATFAFATEQRRREIGLLRAVGATPRQVRRMIIAEAAVVGLLASGTGCVLGALATPVLRSWMTSHGVAPAWFNIPVTAPPLLIAFAVGVASALAGAIAASWRAARVPPGEALRDTASSSSVMTGSRWVLGLGLLGVGAYAGRAIITGSPANAMIVKDDMPALVLIVAGCALLAPVLLRPVARAATGPLARAGAGSMVVRQNVLWAGRRTAAIAAPVVLALGLAIAMLAIEASASATAQAAALSQQPTALPGVSAHDQAQNRQATAVILGMALIYCFIAIANTTMIAARARNREIAALGLAGATRRQVLVLVAAESALTAAIGAIVAAVAAAVVICGQHAALTRFANPAPVVIPWQPLSVITAACLTVAVAASVLSTARSLRKPLIELAGLHE